MRTNSDLTASDILGGAGLTATASSNDLANPYGKGVKVVFDVTAGTSLSLVLTIEGKDPASGKYYTILTGASVTGAATNVYTVYPGVTTASNVAVSNVIPRTWRVTVTASNTNAGAYTVGASVIV